MVDAIQRVKQETQLILNLHPGLIDPPTAQALHGAIDFASLEIPSDSTIRDVFGLKATRADYKTAYHTLRAAGIPVVPHIAVYNGDEHHLLTGLVQTAGETPPEVIVIIVFSPTRDTPMADEPAPLPEAVGAVIQKVKGMFPKTEIALGCMRPRGREIRQALEEAALDAGVTRMELPSQATLALARRRGYEVTRFDACCALPGMLEGAAHHSA
jgi:uncharacterized radical SAM superfamily protein